jgi:heptosyltransferase-2
MANNSIVTPDCKKFTGYKPCTPGKNCLEECDEKDKIGNLILIINLDAMGDVLMTTAQLPAIKKKYPESTIYWLTLKNAAPLLLYNEFIDKVLIWDYESILLLRSMEFDVVMNVDKSTRACSLVKSLKSKNKLGFGLNKFGSIIPMNDSAHYNYILGLNDDLKFKVNQRTGQDILSETLEVEYIRNEYILNLTDEELNFCKEYKKKHQIHDKELVVGFNTGCSELYPNKKMTIEQHVYLIEKLSNFDKIKIVLLGGPEDTTRNNQIGEYVGDKAILTPTTQGVRRGVCYENIADIVITGDSFGMHVAIALRKFVIAWFGLSCWTEIDLFDRGIKLTPDGLFCAPCWKRVCPYNLECISGIDLDNIVEEVLSFKKRLSK